MEVNKAEFEVLQNAIKEWEKEGKLSPIQSRELREDLSVRKSERQILAKYFFVISISCALLAFGAIFIDERLLEKLKLYFSLSNILIALVTGIIAVIWFWYVNKRKSSFNPFTYEIYMVPGALCSLCCLVYAFKDINQDPSHIAMLSCATVLLCLMGVVLRSNLLWAGGMMSLLLWFGALSTTLASHNLFLGMNYAVRYAALGFVILALSLPQSKISPLSYTWRVSYSSGLLLFLVGMWGVSIFGNYSTLDEWWKVRQSHELVYGILFGLVAIIVLLAGIKYKDTFARDTGVLFILINLYTRYFEYFWDTMNKGIFFLVLALTFGLIGRWLERSKRRKQIKT